MIGLLLIYFIGKYFFDLAEKFNKSKWPFAILGVVSYYAGTFIFGAILGVLMLIFGWGDLDSMNDFLIGVIAMPFGILVCWLTYKFLEKKWGEIEVDQDILDRDF